MIQNSPCLMTFFHQKPTQIHPQQQKIAARLHMAILSAASVFLGMLDLASAGFGESQAEPQGGEITFLGSHSDLLNKHRGLQGVLHSL